MPLTYVTGEEVNAFLAHTQVTLTESEAEDEDELELLEKNYVLGRLRATYDVDGWTGADDTPALVRSLIAMRMAGRIFLRQMSQYNLTEDNYGRALLQDAVMLLEDISAGVITLDEQQEAVDTAAETYEYVDPLFSTGQIF